MKRTTAGLLAFALAALVTVSAGQPASAQEVLTGPAPAEAVGNQDGAPIEQRYLANQHNAGGTRWAGEQLLLFDARGRGRIAVVFGDLARATSIAVVVPGSDVDLPRFDNASTPLRSPYGMAEALHRESGDGTAVIAWLGYQTPEGVGVDAATGRLARAGAVALTGFVRGLAAVRPGVPLRLFCHSYGSVVCGLAAHDLPADDLVFTGSPGVRADSAAALHTTARVWAARAVDDWTKWVPNVRIGDLGHGPDPTDPDFGARPFSVAGAVKHEDYYQPGTESLRNLARIAAGQVKEVTR
ncbi:hypothetical protein F0L68_30760 [Solihabitans fulvus]|uniref:DUF1023 domain-containing protein n=1 Tax=Solihabitans fulvus TaxID=1892852 RepID=A0A5B2WV15_9PSEU|nr:alpha/beta hydrolase [Solihabitans fulvus]KAA2254306.1 hypothetical protein F0L68_30760 [Solihabitans fulvus]